MDQQREDMGLIPCPTCKRLMPRRPGLTDNNKLTEAAGALLSACQQFLQCEPRDRRKPELEEIVRAAVNQAMLS